jgi:prolipoprotein diacylglyceryltransferase
MLTPWYGIAMLAGMMVSAVVWGRMFRSEPQMVVVFAAGFLGALLGAKVGFIIAEAPLHIGTEDFWLQMLWGKTILCALVGGAGGSGF